MYNLMNRWKKKMKSFINELYCLKTRTFFIELKKLKTKTLFDLFIDIKTKLSFNKLKNEVKMMIFVELIKKKFVVIREQVWMKDNCWRDIIV